ncbi:ATPase P, partial [Achromatium sp. WMS2]
DNNGVSQILDDQSAINVTLDTMANRSMRLIAIATSQQSVDPETKLLPNGLTLVGIVGLRDELRAESKPAVLKAQQAGIQVVMITGDRKETAHAIAKDVGLIERPDALVLTSTEIEDRTDAELKEIFPRLRVVARAYPHTKSRLVRIGQELGAVVGMTGDGVNDAAALKLADVGFAMGSGTEVAKEAGDIVILDDNFSSITRAILYGRTLFKSIRKFLVFQLTVNVAAILVAFLGPFFGFDLPLTVIQLLWINIIMDTLAGLAMSGEAALERYMQEPPIPRNEPIITKDMWSSILVNGPIVAAISLLFLTSHSIHNLFRPEAFLTAFFAFFVFINAFNTFNARTDRRNLFENILDNTGFLPVLGIIFTVQIVFTYVGGEVLRTVGLTLGEWLAVLILASIIIPIDLARKTLRDQLGTNTSTTP